MIKKPLLAIVAALITSFPGQASSPTQFSVPKEVSPASFASFAVQQAFSPRQPSAPNEASLLATASFPARAFSPRQHSVPHEASIRAHASSEVPAFFRAQLSVPKEVLLAAQVSFSGHASALGLLRTSASGVVAHQGTRWTGSGAPNHIAIATSTPDGANPSGEPASVIRFPVNGSSVVSTDTIVVMPFENLSGRAEYNWVGESFAASLADLLDKPGLVGIRPDERNVAYKQEGLPPTAILTHATMIKIAERAGANLVVMGTYRIAGEGRDSTITITARVIDIREGRLIGKEYNRGGPLVDLQRMQGDLAYEILYQRNPALPFSRDQITSDATVTPIGAFENFIKGTLTHDRDARTNFLQRAIKEYEDKTKAQYIAAIFELGRVYYEQGEYKDAAEQLVLIPERDPRFDESQFYLGAAQAMLGHTDQALGTYKKLAARLPLFEVYSNIGVLLIRNKQFKDAVDHLKPASEAAPRDSETLFNLGYGQFLLRDYTGSAATLRQEIKLRPSDGESFYLLSKALGATGDQAGAAAMSDQAKKLLSSYAQWETKGTPDLARFKMSFSKINYYRYKRDQDERLNTETQISGLTPQVDELLQNARSAFSGGRDEDALSDLGKLLQSAPQNYEAHLLMGRIYERRGDFERATNALKAAVFWNPKLTSAYVLLGRIAVLKNDCPAADSAASKALQIDAADADALALRRLIEEKCKQQ